MQGSVKLGLAAALVAISGCGNGSGRVAPASAAAAVSTVSAAAAASAVTPAAARATVRGSLHRADGQPAEAFLVFASLSTGEAPDADPGALFSDAGGQFLVEVPTDTYELTAITADGLVARVQVDATSGAVAPLQLRLEHDTRAWLDFVEKGAQ